MACPTRAYRLGTAGGAGGGGLSGARCSFLFLGLWVSGGFLGGRSRGGRALYGAALYFFDADVVVLEGFAGGSLEGGQGLDVGSSCRHFGGAGLRDVALILQHEEVGGESVGELLILDLERLLLKFARL